MENFVTCANNSPEVAAFAIVWTVIVLCFGALMTR